MYWILTFSTQLSELGVIIVSVKFDFFYFHAFIFNIMGKVFSML